MYKKEIRTALLTIAVGATSGKASLEDVPRGSKVFVGATARPAQDQIVRLGVDENGQRVQAPLDVNWYDGGIGAFEQRAIELPYQGGTKIDFIATVDTAIADTDLEIEVVVQSWVPCS